MIPYDEVFLPCFMAMCVVGLTESSRNTIHICMSCIQQLILVHGVSEYGGSKVFFRKMELLKNFHTMYK